MRFYTRLLSSSCADHIHGANDLGPGGTESEESRNPRAVDLLHLLERSEPGVGKTLYQPQPRDAI